jgi:hypothetical protein
MQQDPLDVVLNLEVLVDKIELKAVLWSLYVKEL